MSEQLRPRSQKFSLPSLMKKRQQEGKRLVQDGQNPTPWQGVGFWLEALLPKAAAFCCQQKLAEVELNTPEEDPSSFLLLTLTPIYSVCKKRSIPVPKGEDLDLKFFVWTQPAGELNVVAMTFSVCACMLLSCVCVCVPGVCH